ncbi:MAG: S49 family peptidase [Bauldia sp.]
MNPLEALAARLAGAGPVVPVLRLAGVIAPGGRLGTGPSLNIERLADPLRRAFAVKGAPAVALIVNSPGGSAVQSHMIARRIRALADEKEKRVLVFVEDVAASGGYMIAVAGDEIFVDPSSILGSIGVVAASFGFQALIEKIGVERRLHTAGTKKAMLDPFLPERPEEVAHLEALQKEIHAKFIALVRERRGKALREDEPDLFSGSFWTGEKAIALGLADAVGDIRSVLRSRYGEKVRLKPMLAERRTLLRRLGIDALAGMPADAMMAVLEERGLWGRYGL